MCKTHNKKSCQKTTSPAAKKMQRLHLKLSQEKKDAHKEKDRHSKNENVTLKLRRNVLNTRRLIVTVS